MSDLVVLGFDSTEKADQVLSKLVALQKEHLIDLEDAAVVVRDENGKCQVKQAVNLTAAGAAGPLVGVLAGTAAGAISGSLADFGINDNFIKELGDTLQNGSSALFVMVRKATPDKVIEEVKGYNGKVLHTSLSIKEETALKEALDKAHQELANA